ncbi:MAG: DUF1289 domain-containing protein [Hellea sp.]
MSLSLTPQIQSPCKLICELDLEKGLCKGCGRLREEIAMWTRYTDAQRAFIMTELDERLEKLGAKQVIDGAKSP